MNKITMLRAVQCRLFWLGRLDVGLVRSAVGELQCASKWKSVCAQESTLPWALCRIYPGNSHPRMYNVADSSWQTQRAMALGV